MPLLMAEPKLVSGESSLEELAAVRFKWTIKNFREILNFGGKTIKSPIFFKTNAEEPSSRRSTNPCSFQFTDLCGSQSTNLCGSQSTSSSSPQSNNPAKKVPAFHLEMEIPYKSAKMQCPVYIVNETGQEFLTKVALERYSPTRVTHTRGAISLLPYIEVSMEPDASQDVTSSSQDVTSSSRDVTSSSSVDRKKVLTVTLPDSGSLIPDEIKKAMTVTLPDRESFVPDEIKDVLNVAMPAVESFIPDEITIEVKVTFFVLTTSDDPKCIIL
jgi:hypothetical protein